MADSDLQIAIRVDASGARDGADQAKSAIAGIGPQIDALGKTLGELGKSLKTGLDGLSQVGKAIAGVGKESGGQLQSVAISLRIVSEAAAGLGIAATAGLQAVARSASEMASALSGGKLGGVSAGLESMSEAVAGVGRTAPAGLKSVSTAASELSVTLGSAAGQVASELALLGEAASGVAGVALAIGQVALTAAAATAEWAQNTANSATASDEARQNAANLNQAVGAASDAFSAVGDTLANAFAPALTTVVGALAGLANGFESSYKQGGAAKAIVDTLIFAFRLLAAIVEIAIGAIIGVIESVRSQIQQWRDEFDIAKTAVGGGVEYLGIEFHTLGRTFSDVFSGDFGKAVDDFNSGLAAMQQHAQRTVAEVQRQFAKLSADQIAGAKAAAGGALGGVHAALGSLGLARPVGAGGGGASKRHALAVGGGAPAGGAQGTQAGGGEGCDCDPAAAKACATDAATGKTEAIKTDQTENVAAVQLGADQIAALNQGVTDKFKDNKQQETASADQAENTKVQATQAAATKIDEANARTLKQFELSMKALVNTFAKGLAQMVEGTRSFGQVMRTIGQQVLDDIFKVVVGMVEKWAWGVTEQVLATQRGQMLLQALGLKDLALAIANDTRKTAAHSAANAVKAASDNSAATAGQAAQLALTLTTLKQDAAKVFGGIFAALSSNPFTLPAAAPAAAAGAAAVMSFSVAAGGYDIPAGVNPLTQLHAQEMVLPARLANPMRDMLSSYRSGAAPAGVGGHTFSFGDTHIHGAPNMSPSDFKQALAEHRGNVAEAVAGALRSGWRPSYRQPVGAL